MIAKDSTNTPISQRQWDALVDERDALAALLLEVLNCYQQAIPDWLTNDIWRALQDKP